MTRDSRLLFAAKGVGTFFLFLVPFLAASTYFGGGLAGISVSVMLALIVAAGLVTIWPRFHQEAKPTQIVSKKTSHRKNDSTYACPSGPYAVVSGSPTRVGLNIEPGEKLDGFVEEIDGDYFDWFIVNENNMIRFLNGEDFDYVSGDENVQASKVKCRISQDGPWYLMLDIGNRRYDRKVVVNFRVIP
jgi:hypothetical protein